MRLVTAPFLIAAAVAACSGERHAAVQPVGVAPVAGARPVAPRTAESPVKVYRQFVVAADHPLASQAGAEILAKGGNAVDAAVATSFALSVVRPESCGIGGGGFMMVHLVERPATGDKPHRPAVDVCIDYRERCPAAVGPDYFENLPDGSSTRSGHAVAIPGNVAGLLHALEQYGTLDRATVLAPAIRIAQEGYVSDFHMARSMPVIDRVLGATGEEAWPGKATLERWYGPGRTIGGLLRSPEQAEAIRLIAQRGADGFYKGALGEAIIAAVRAHGGAMTMEDLASYRCKEVVPLRGSFRGNVVLTMPLPSSGGLTMLEVFALLERRQDLTAGARPGDGAYDHVVAECFKHAFADRAQYLGDPEFMAVDPTAQILDPARMDAKARMIDGVQTLEPAAYAEAVPLKIAAAEGFPEDHGTSHFSIVDRWGNAVACTETINLEFGSMIPVEGYGFCLNDQMDDFLTRRGKANAFKLTQSERNLPAPGKRPLSSMTPTIVLNEKGDVIAVAGASGGPRIITGTTQALLNAMVYGMPAPVAVNFARVHHQWSPDVLFMELPPSLSDATIEQPASWCLGWPEVSAGPLLQYLKQRGHQIKRVTEPAAVQLITRGDAGGGWSAACDPRKGGAPAGR